MIGNTDKPIETMGEDVLKVEKYITGLSKFIKSCDTPMTIAIQGDWGSGKTSFMNMIKSMISGELLTAWVNTWQFSQFNLGDSLTTLLLSALTESLQVETDNLQKVKQTLKKLGRIAYRLSVKTASNLSGIDIEDSMKVEEEPENIINMVVELKKRFQNCVNEALKKEGCTKFVIFVDDLDRLPPAKAVEVLEVLKLFLDCEGCVFVLAIDYKVVCHGVNQKYGDGFDEEKGRNFFDKIIQVPFKIPIAHYSIESYIEKNLDKLNCNIDCLEVYAKLISHSIGYNPRGIKRIFNAFSLLKEIYSSEDLSSSYKQSLLFAALCMQLSYEDLYNYVIRNENEDIDASFFKMFTLMDSDSRDRAAALLEDIDLSRQAESVMAFMRDFCDTLSNNTEKDITDDSMVTLFEILNIAGTMSRDDDLSVYDNGRKGKAIRYQNTYDEQFSTHSIFEDIEKINKPSGWNNCQIESYELFGHRHQVSNLSETVINVLAEFHKANEDLFHKVRASAEQYKLYGLFYGSKNKNGLSAAQKIPDTEIYIESKNSYNQKIQYLRYLVKAMGYSEADLKLNVKLAHRLQTIK